MKRRIILIPCAYIAWELIRRFPQVWHPDRVDLITPAISSASAIQSNRNFFTLVAMLILLLTLYFLPRDDEVGSRSPTKKTETPLTYFGVGLLFFALVIAATNVYINPWHLYPTNWAPSRIENSRSDKIQLFQELNHAPEILVLGTSRSYAISASQIQDLTGMDAFNAAVLNGRLIDYLLFAQYVYRANPESPPKLILAEVNGLSGLDEENTLLNTPYPWISFLPLDQRFEWWTFRVKHLFSASQLADAIYSIRYFDLYSGLDKFWEEWTLDSSGSGTRETTPYFNEILENVISRDPDVSCHFSELSPYYSDLIRLASSHGTRILFFTVPYHPQYYSEVLALDPDYQTCKKLIEDFMAKQIESGAPVTYVNFDQLASIHGVDTNLGFYDHQHITPLNSSLLIDALAPTIQEQLMP